MVDEDEIEHVTMLPVRTGVRKLVGGLVTKEGVGDRQTILDTEVQKTDT